MISILLFVRSRSIIFPLLTMSDSSASSSAKLMVIFSSVSLALERIYIACPSSAKSDGDRVSAIPVILNSSRFGTLILLPMNFSMESSSIALPRLSLRKRSMTILSRTTSFSLSGIEPAISSSGSSTLVSTSDTVISSCAPSDCM